MRSLHGVPAVAGRILLPGLPNKEDALASDARSVGMRRVPPPDIRNGWHDPGKNTDSIDNLVRSRMACDYCQERPFRQDPGTNIGHQLPDSVVDAATIPSVNGA